jgi:cytochrome c peroxidase
MARATMKLTSVAALSLLVTASVVGCDKKPEGTANPNPKEVATAAAAATASAAAATDGEIDPTTLLAFRALPAVMEGKDNAITDAKVDLGRALFYDTRLSAGKDVSCNTCHLLSKFGVDGTKVSTGHKKQTGKRNSPSVYNAAGHSSQFWDGRAKDVEEQAKGPVLNPVEMAMPDEKAVVAELSKVKWYGEQFKKAFPDDKAPVSFDNFAKAVGAFERKLVTPSRWDKYLAGDKAAITAEEKAGFKAFTGAGCPTCHAGAYVGGAMFQKLGLAKPWPDEKDLGRFEVTKEAAEKMFFKVPGLRNVEKTAPYFHDGSVATLDEAIKQMGRYELAREITDAEATSIATWLKTLTGEVPADLIAEAKIPAEARPPAAKTK